MSPVTDRATMRRNEILDAAERIFADKGYHDTGIADIAAHLGIGHGTFYRYFKNKREIADRIMDRVISHMAAVGLAEDPEASDTIEAYRAQVSRILGGMLELAGSQPHLVRFFHQQSLVVDADRLARVLDQYAVFSQRFLINGVSKGFLRPDLDVECTAQALVSLIFEGMRRVLSTEDEHFRRRWIASGMALMFDGVKR